MSDLECCRNRDCVGVGGVEKIFKDEIWVKFAMIDIVELKIMDFGGSSC